MMEHYKIATTPIRCSGYKLFYSHTNSIKISFGNSIQFLPISDNLQPFSHNILQYISVSFTYNFYFCKMHFTILFQLFLIYIFLMRFNLFYCPIIMTCSCTYKVWTKHTSSDPFINTFWKEFFICKFFS